MQMSGLNTIPLVHVFHSLVYQKGKMFVNCLTYLVQRTLVMKRDATVINYI